MVNDYSVYRIAWSYWYGSYPSGAQKEGHIFCVAKTPDEAFRRFKQTDQYKWHKGMIGDSGFQIDKVTRTKLPIITADGAKHISLDVTLASQDDSSLTLEFKVQN